MSLSAVFQRILRQRRTLLVLLAAMCLVTGFFAFSPLYLNVVADAALSYTLQTNPPERFSLEMRSDERMDTRYESVIRDRLGALVSQTESISQSATFFCGEALRSPQARCYIDGRYPFGFSRLTDRFEVVEGRFPETLTNPTGTYDIEGVVTTGVVESSRIFRTDLSVGAIVNIPPLSGAPVRVKIVGHVQPTHPDDPIWETRRLVTQGIVIDVDDNNQRLDFGLIVPESEIDRVFEPIALDGMTYFWHLTTDVNVLRSASLNDLNARLNAVEGDFRTVYAHADLIGFLRTTLQQFIEQVANAQPPVILLSCAVLVLMLYQLVTTVAMILEQDGAEWATLASRGGSTFQLVSMQAITMAVVGAAAFVIGLPLALVLTGFLTRFGPLAQILSASTVSLNVPPLSLALSAAAAAAAVIILTLPAIPAAGRGILRLKQSVSRPPTRPLWARYALDFVFLAVGGALLVRLYYQVGGSASEGIGALIANPSLLLNAITSDQAAQAGILSDPFNLAAAALLIAGAALLWLRFFPLLMRFIGWIVGRLNNLLVPLALWGVERDPGHYTHLVTLLIGTLVLGTASLALAATHDAGAWRVAQHQIGGDVSISVQQDHPEAVDAIRATAGVTSAEGLMRYTTASTDTLSRLTLFGVDPAALATALPDTTAALDPLAQTEPFPLAGLDLPAGTMQIGLHVRIDPSFAPPPLPRTRLAVQIEDANAVRHTIEMTTPDPTLTGEFLPFVADLPPAMPAPLRLTGIQFLGEAAFRGLAFLDALTAMDANGQSTLVESWENQPNAAWTQPNQRLNGAFVTVVQAFAAEGRYSLRVEYTFTPLGARLIEPVVIVNQVNDTALIVPLVVSPRFAEVNGRRAGLRRAFRVGDTGTLPLELAQTRGTVTIDMPFRIVGITDNFPTVDNGTLYVIARDDHLRRWLNTVATPDAFYADNVVWVHTDQREPPATLVDTIRGIAGVNDLSYAWTQYNALRREPLPNAITGMLFAGFWVSLALAVIDFGLYMALTARRRAVSFAVLRAMGWDSRRVWGLLAVEQTALVVPALVVGVGLGIVLAYLLLPFLALLGREALRVPVDGIGGLLAGLVTAFTILLAITAVLLQRLSVNQVLRTGEE
ncbi:MAG: ABC transporter permease [Anaerolineae bacterium]